MAIYLVLFGAGLVGLEWLHRNRVNTLLMRTGEVAAAFSERIAPGEVLELYRNGRPFGSLSGSPHPYYEKYLAKLASLKGLSPDWIPYIFVVLPEDEDVNDRCADQLPVVYLVDSLKVLDPDSALEFKEVDCTSDSSLKAALSGQVVHRLPYRDEWGDWLSVYVGIPHENPDEIMVVFAIDIPAERLTTMRQQTISVMVAYGVFLSIFTLAASAFIWRWYRSLTRFATNLTILEEYKKESPGDIEISRELVHAIIADIQLSVDLAYLREVGRAAREKRRKLTQDNNANPDQVCSGDRRNTG